MHETDQASILRGALDLATGEPAGTAYNYDKQFVSYWLLGALIQLLPRPLSPERITLAGNLLSFAVFWGALTCHLARCGWRSSPVFLLAILLAPAFVLHSPFFATAFVAGGFLLLLPPLLSLRPGGRGGILARRLAIFAAVVAAVGARADSVLALPLLVLLFVPKRAVKALVRSADAWLVLAAALAALLAGRLLAEGESLNYLPPFFHAKIFAAYVVFGLGAATLLLPVCVAALGACAVKRRSRRFGMLLLAVALALPLLYYCIQLTSTRYFVLGLICLLWFLGSKRGAAVVQVIRINRLFAGSFKWVMAVAAVAPIFVGLNASVLRHPRLTWKHPTHFPTADGSLPMGAYLNHSLKLRAARGLVDHNHALWLAAVHSDLASVNGDSPAILRTPMCDYLMLAARLQGQHPRLVEVDAAEALPVVCVDSRSLMRRTVVDLASLSSTPSLSSFLSSRSLRQISSLNIEGLTVFEATIADSNSPVGQLILALNSELQENEYRLMPGFVITPSQAVPHFTVEAVEAGKTLVLLSRQKFQSTIQDPGGLVAYSDSREINPPGSGRWFVLRHNRLKPHTQFILEAPAGAEITRAITVYPDWMSLGKL